MSLDKIEIAIYLSYLHEMYFKKFLYKKLI